MKRPWNGQGCTTWSLRPGITILPSGWVLAVRYPKKKSKQLRGVKLSSEVWPWLAEKFVVFWRPRPKKRWPSATSATKSDQPGICGFHQLFWSCGTHEGLVDCFFLVKLMGEKVIQCDSSVMKIFGQIKSRPHTIQFDEHMFQIGWSHQRVCHWVFEAHLTNAFVPKLGKNPANDHF